MTDDYPVYLDCNATTPVEPEVLDLMNHYFRVDYGNAGSRTHRYGSAAAQAVRRAREQVADVVDASWENVLFTSGATESNNLAIFGLAEQAQKLGRTHIISTQIEHKAVLEPLEQLARRGFDVTLLPPCRGGYVDAEQIRAALRPDTCLVSVMQVNNETGVIQPLAEIADVLNATRRRLPYRRRARLRQRAGWIATRASGPDQRQRPQDLRPQRRGCTHRTPERSNGATRPVLLRRRPGARPATGHRAGAAGRRSGLSRGTRSTGSLRATREVPRIPHGTAVCVGAASNQLFIGDTDRVLPHVVSLRFGDIDSEAVMIALRDEVAISNGSACTSTSYQPSHVLQGDGAIRLARHKRPRDGRGAT